MTALIIITSYIAHVFLCRWIFKKAYHINEDPAVRERVETSFIPLVGLIVATITYSIETEYSNRGNGGTWFNGKNW